MSKRNRIAIILIIAAIVMTIIGATFAYWSWQSSVNEQTAVTFTVAPTFSCSADGGGNITSNEKILIPTSCTNANYAIKRTVKVNTTISDNNAVYLDMWLKINQIGTGLANSENFMYALTTSDQGCNQGTVIASGSFYGGQQNDTFNLLEGKKYQTSTTGDTYYLYIWLDTAESNSATQDQTFDMELGGECTNEMPSTIINTLAETAVMDNIRSTYVTNANGIQFNATSSNTNGKGIYIRSGTENDPYPIYYYRGEVNNNNVLFGGFCWKIVRTTSTGGTKLIYNGVPTGTNNDKCENTTGVATQLASTSPFNAVSTSPADVGYMYGIRYVLASQPMTNISDTYMYGTGYDGTNHKLVSTDSMNFAGTAWGTYYNQLSNNHYTCFNTSGECNEVNYIFYTTNTSVYYITIPSGKTINGMLDEMLTSSSNTINSTVKTTIDTWYATNMTSYTNKLEDTQYCNDRTIYQYGGWSPTGGTSDTDDLIFFGSYQRIYSTHTPAFTCNTNDAFTVSTINGNGKLTYPVGLLTADEIVLAGGYVGQNCYLFTNLNWWSSSPAYINNLYGVEFNASEYGGIGNRQSYADYGVRPAISLKPGTSFSGGTGIATDPYVVTEVLK